MGAHSIWVLEYSRSPVHPVSGVFYGAHNQGTMNLPFAYILVKSGDAVVLVDVGHDAADFGGQIANSIGVTGWTDPEVVLGECGVRPQDVTHVILTHAHFDHIGGLKFFPNAKIFIQKKELESWMWILAKGSRFRCLQAGLNPADILYLTQANIEGRLELVDGERENLLPGIHLYPAFDTHTAGSQYVVVQNGKGDDRIVLSGDVVYTYKNLSGGDDNDPCFVPPGLANGSQTRLIESAEEMLGMVGNDERRIIPVHEEQLSKLYPSRVTERALTLVEVCLADGERSRV
ncbi:N-acyl homoserine lactonase family protein [Rhizobium laguerreae]|uniref:N-acyl homoserine lactonase family protein n=1 Tax=Rhizobium laguerreae TaxID=1076926 RepID=UPI001C90FF55|nr:N-acyl homoserine lactonase family protein [Rhizobium laguerreae]MBY3468683.1 N-acyl homoserine lactonase family protein [Rhizobium laguerreae]